MGFNPSGFDQSAFDPNAFEFGEPSESTGSFVGGWSVDASGVGQTLFLDDGTPVPGTAIMINGFAHSAGGLRYVCPWPSSGIVSHIDGIARRADGAMCIIDSGTPFPKKGWALTGRGEVIISTSAPQLIVGGLGLRYSGSVCVSEAA